MSGETGPPRAGKWGRTPFRNEQRIPIKKDSRPIFFSAKFKTNSWESPRQTSERLQ